MKLLTIVTPTYNQSQYLDECIRSVLLAIDETCDYIIVNDGSTDDTIAVMNKYKNHPQVKLVNQNNQGQCKTLNEQWMIADSKYLTYLSSDDVVEKGAFIDLLRVIDSDETVSAVYPDFQHFDTNGNVKRNVSNGDFDRKKLFTKLICQPGPSTIFRKSALLAVGGWREDLRITPDLEFWMRVSLIGRIMRHPKSLAKYRIHNESQSTGRMSRERANEILKIPLIVSSYDTNISINIDECKSSSYFRAARYNINNGRFITSIMQTLLSLLFLLRSKL